VKWAEKARPGYWAQDHAGEFATDELLADWMGRWRRADKGDDDQIVRATLGQLLFTGDDQKKSVQVLSGAAAGRTLDLTKNLTTVGKPGLQVAVITRRPNGYFITHVEGATYPTLNGTSLGPQAHQLNDHDLIEIAGVKMEFFHKP
jgi:hypothetical protein